MRNVQSLVRLWRGDPVCSLTYLRGLRRVYERRVETTAASLDHDLDERAFETQRIREFGAIQINRYLCDSHPMSRIRDLELVQLGVRLTGIGKQGRWWSKATA